MEKIGRNDPCPCGSGRKFKKCCGSPIPEERRIVPNSEVPENAVAAMYEEQENRFRIFTDDMVLNQLRREGPKIAESFDNNFERDLKEISEQFSLTFALLACGTMRSCNTDEAPVRSRCCPLLLNASQTIIAALDVLRHGFRLQPGVLMRSAIETICVVVSLFTGQTSLQNYDAGVLSSPKAVTHAKRVIPILGELYGFFSREFAHLGNLHKELHSWDLFAGDDEAAAINLSFVKLGLNLLTATTELVLYEYTPDHRYWKKLGTGHYGFEPSEAEKEWQSQFLGRLLGYGSPGQ